MALTLPIAIPCTPSAGNSPASDDSSLAPRTPTSPHNLPASMSSSSSNDNNNNANSAADAIKRKPSRRANTAERRATHNAVERQRRETLNGRFLDLAQLLPNLSQIRRPSKSSIVNSSIAHIHASRRHRMLAARELKYLKVEADALRRELNEWRDRSGLPRVEEPARGDGFRMVMDAEVEVLAGSIAEEDEGGEDDYGDEDSAYPRSAVDEHHAQQQAFAMAQAQAHHAAAQAQAQQEAEMRAAAMLKTTSSPYGNIMPRPSPPQVVVAPPTVNFENPAMSAVYDHHSPASGSPASFGYLQQQMEADKWSQQLFQSAQRQMFTPPQSAHGLSVPSPQASFPSPVADHFAFYPQQQPTADARQFVYGSPDSVGSGEQHHNGQMGGRPRSGSVGSSASGGYPEQHLTINTQFGGAAVQAVHSPISVGGGGNGTGFMMMM